MLLSNILGDFEQLSVTVQLELLGSRESQQVEFVLVPTGAWVEVAEHPFARASRLPQQLRKETAAVEAQTFRGGMLRCFEDCWQEVCRIDQVIVDPGLDAARPAND